jgi:hypothetical protein
LNDNSYWIPVDTNVGRFVTTPGPETPTSTRKPSAHRMKRIRKLHLYLGTLFAPAIIFFAFTGALQTFGFHENSKGSGEPPPKWIAKLAEVHKNQRFNKPSATGATHQEKHVSPESTRPRNPLPAAIGPRPTVLALKCFVFFMAFGLITTTGLGIYMSFKYNRDKRIVYALLFAGIALPLTLLLS